MKKTLWALCLLFILPVCKAERTLPAIIPAPSTLDLHAGQFTIDSKTRVYCTENALPTAEAWAERIRQSTGLPLPVEVKDRPAGRPGAICFILPRKPDNEQDESYTLDVMARSVVVRSKSQAGLFYGSQTLRQLLPPQIEADSVVDSLSLVLPALHISDSPRFKWRGYMLDVSRTFSSIEVVKKYLDLMALYKMNVFHFHLTDDQGWRMEIKKYPRLTSEKATVYPPEYGRAASHSGFYTQEELKELVRYAAERHIEIVPEIDIPGHSWPVLICYPELAVSNNLYPDYIMPFTESYHVWGNQFTPNTLDPTKESVYRFLDDVLTEVAEVFPSQYIHIGCDEVRHEVWEKQPHIQAFMKEHHMTRIEEVQSYFVQRVSKLITDKGRRPMGWNDILADAGNLPKSTCIMSWLGANSVKEAARYGFHTVATPSSHLYLDICQADRNDGVRADLAYSHTIRLEDVYNYDPAKGLTPDEQKYLLGIQANLWTNVMHDAKDINVQTFPRLLAAAEIGWTTVKEKNFKNFQTRTDSHLPRLKALHTDYYQPGGYIVGTWQPSDIVTVDYRTLEWDVTDRVYASGSVMAGLYFTKGKNPLNIKRMQLLENGQVIAEDTHRGFADLTRATGKRKTYLYQLAIDRYRPEARYTLRAEVSGYGGTDSYGNAIFSLSPYQPFTATEPTRKTASTTFPNSISHKTTPNVLP